VIRTSTRLFATTWQRVLLLMLAGASFAQIGYAYFAAAPLAAPLDPVCAAWDRQARLAAGLQDAETGPTRASPTDLLFRLRRARRSCRDGHFSLARADYDAIRILAAAARHARLRLLAPRM